MTRTRLARLMDARLTLIHEWTTTLPPDLGIVPDSVRPASADASFRRYFRLNATGVPEGSLILMDAPPPQEDVAPFIHAAEVLRRAGLSVPRIVAQDAPRGLLALEDFGDLTYLAHLSSDRAPDLYAAAHRALIRLQQGTDSHSFAPYDARLLQAELALFPQWFLDRHHGLTLSPHEQAGLQAVFDCLIQAALAQPQVHVHRDFHARNLMVLPNPRNPGVLDFQDAVLGPITYDLVSLWRDAYLAWDEAEVLDGVARYWELARQAQLPVTADFGMFYRDFEWMGLQRHLKILGIFARLYHRDGKDRYLADLPRVLDYVHTVVARYAVFAPLGAVLARLSNNPAQVGYTF